MPEQITGVIERITFHNEDNGYCVLRVAARGHRDVVTVVGHCQQVVAGEYVTATGDWVTDRTHGQQFKATEIKTNPPHTAEGIARYLGSGLVKGIGPKYAKRIVEVFGDKTLEVIDKWPTQLEQVKGIGPKLIEKIRKSWGENQGARKVMVFLHSLQIGTALATKIYRHFAENGEEPIPAIKANPYRLCNVWGVGFKTADAIAQNLGIPRDSPFRAQAAVRHVLNEEAGNGHVGYPEAALREQAAELTGIDENGIIDAIEQLRITDEVVRDSPTAAKGGPHPPTPSPRGEGEKEGDRALADAERTTRFSELAGRDRNIPEALLRRARELRRDQTTAEQFLWECLRDHQLCNAKFRRQHNVGPFIADFYCHEAKLCIELDGDVHDIPDQQEKDRRRDQWLLENGFALLRLRNEQVLRTPIEALNTIAGFLSPPLPGERGPGGEGLVFLKPLFFAELGVARSIKALANGPHPLPDVNVDAAIKWAETKMQLAFADSQRAAIRAAVTNKVMVVTGGPGTGKTTIVRAIIEMFLAKRLNVVLTAPTGRAAKRLSESTGREAKTIHRLLGFNPKTRDYLYTDEEPLDTDLVVVDETSMVDVVLMNKLLRAIPDFACVVFVGDVDQLPSVGAGAVLTDLIDSGAVAVARLTEVHRQAESSWIVRAAHAVNHGSVPESAPPNSDGDFYFIEANEPDAIITRIVQMVRDRIPAKFGFDPFRDIQVLSPQVKTGLGVAALNKELQAVLNPAQAGTPEVKRMDSAFRVGDKVMQVQNNYDREVFNGDIGRITEIDTDDRTLFVDFDGRSVEYDFTDLDELQLSYSCSIHKAQGSEYPAVVIPVHTQHFVMLQRNLIYTGITRGRKLVVLVGSRKALWIAANTADTKMRHSLLKWRLQRKDQKDEEE